MNTNLLWLSAVILVGKCILVVDHKCLHAIFRHTAARRPELKQTTPVPQNESVDFDQDAAWVNNLQLQQASSELEAVKNCMAQAKK
jgi:hypothetical protein